MLLCQKCVYGENSGRRFPLRKIREAAPALAIYCTIAKKSLARIRRNVIPRGIWDKFLLHKLFYAPSTTCGPTNFGDDWRNDVGFVNGQICRLNLLINSSTHSHHRRPYQTFTLQCDRAVQTLRNTPRVIKAKP